MSTLLSLTPEEVATKAMRLYQETLQAILETPENIGRFLSIDVESGNYVLSPERWESSRQLKASHPNAIIYTMRIGYPAAVSLSGRGRSRSEQIL